MTEVATTMGAGSTAVAAGEDSGATEEGSETTTGKSEIEIMTRNI